MLNEVKHLGLERDLCQIVGVRFFAEFILERSEGLRMTGFICSSQKYTYAEVSQVLNIANSPAYFHRS